MKFWDSSGIVPLLAAQRLTRLSEQLFTEDPEMIVWWAARVECVSALTRLERDGGIGVAEMSVALARLQELGRIWDEVQPTDRVRGRAERLLRTHRLRAADALQLAAALEASGEPPLGLVCFDHRLTEAATREGFQVVRG